jgi:serine/threonine protein kinase
MAPYTVAGRYELGSTLGAGGMAQVFRAHDQLLDRDVALKLFDAAANRDGPDRIRAEMRTLAGLSHPALVAVYDAGTDVPPSGSARAFLVMALVEGRSLAQVILDGPLPAEWVRGIGVRVAEALDFVHSRGVVHRDVKPANVLLDDDGLAYLADFGIARAIEQPTLTNDGQILGTAAFLSPEQVGGQPVTATSDVYALGLLLLEALTGRREYPGTSIETALARLSRQAFIDPDLPAMWRGLLAAMTATDPTERPTAAEVATALRPLPVRSAPDVSPTVRMRVARGAADPEPNVLPPTRALTGGLSGSVPVEPTASVSRRFKLVAIGVAVVALAAIGVAAATAGSNGPSTPPTSGVTSGPTGAAGAQVNLDLLRLRQLVTP